MQTNEFFAHLKMFIYKLFVYKSYIYIYVCVCVCIIQEWTFK